jgi:NADPH2:quinone reductase
MSHAMVLSAPSAADAMIWQEWPVGAPGAGEVVVRHRAIGINFIDVYMRTGLYPLPAWPVVLGMEAAGEVEAVGPGVTAVQIGDRVAYCGAPPGAYCERRVLAAERLFVLPPAISFEVAAASLLKGLTAEYLLFRTRALAPGDGVLVHAAAGGVGLLLCAWAKSLGLTVYGVVGGPAKADLARAHGCTQVFVSPGESFRDGVLAATEGRGVAAVFDSVGKTTLADSLACAGVFGDVVSFGQSAGMPDPVATAQLAPKSVRLSRPTLFHHLAVPGRGREMTERLWSAVAAGTLPVRIGGRYPLREAARAHRDLESRATTGSLVLVPD